MRSKSYVLARWAEETLFPKWTLNSFAKPCPDPYLSGKERWHSSRNLQLFAPLLCWIRSGSSTHMHTTIRSRTKSSTSRLWWKGRFIVNLSWATTRKSVRSKAWLSASTKLLKRYAMRKNSQIKSFFARNSWWQGLKKSISLWLKWHIIRSNANESPNSISRR